jgi:hypothetical protein
VSSARLSRQEAEVAIDIDGKDFTVQMTTDNDQTWKGAGVFADEYSAKQHAMHLMQSHEARGVRVVQTRLYGSHMGSKVQWQDDIGERSDNDRK